MPPPPLFQRSIYQHGWPALSVGQRGGRREWLSVEEPPSCHFASQFLPGIYAAETGDWWESRQVPLFSFPTQTFLLTSAHPSRETLTYPPVSAAPISRASRPHFTSSCWADISSQHVTILNYSPTLLGFTNPAIDEQEQLIVLKLKGFISVPLVLWNGIEKIMKYFKGSGFGWLAWPRLLLLTDAATSKNDFLHWQPLKISRVLWWNTFFSPSNTYC